jgi:hypothetical protein
MLYRVEIDRQIRECIRRKQEKEKQRQRSKRKGTIGRHTEKLRKSIEGNNTETNNKNTKKDIEMRRNKMRKTKEHEKLRI